MGAKKREALEQFNRDNILNAAAELFSSRGVEKTTMDDIAGYADYSKSTIYVYFRSKEDIYNSVVERQYSELIEAATSFELEMGDVRAAYDKLCSCLVGFESRCPSYFASIMGESKTTNSKKKSSTTPAANQEIVDVFKTIYEYGVKKKVFKGRQNSDKISLYMWTTVGGSILYASRNGKYLEKKVGISGEEYLEFCFDKLYQSLT